MPVASETSWAMRELNICTGCGPGAMEAPMKGAAVGHAQQRYKDSRFIGMTEPSIIAAEPLNPLVNELIIIADIEKRLEAFVRIAHGIIIFSRCGVRQKSCSICWEF